MIAGASYGIYVSVYSAEATWGGSPPEALYHGGPVVEVTEPTRAALAQALQESDAGPLDVIARRSRMI